MEFKTTSNAIFNKTGAIKLQLFVASINIDYCDAYKATISLSKWCLNSSTF